MVHMPGVEQLYNLTAVRIVGLDLVDPFDGMATPKREEWIAVLFGPLFKVPSRRTTPV
jgi:hypothetical protein